MAVQFMHKGTTDFWNQTRPNGSITFVRWHGRGTPLWLWAVAFGVQNIVLTSPALNCWLPSQKMRLHFP